MSSSLYYCPDPSRSFIILDGPDRRAFLQGLISNDIEKCDDDHVIWSALLTPQGKFLHDFFVSSHGGHFLIECEKERLMDLGVRLRKYKLRSDIGLDVETEPQVFLVWGKRDEWDLKPGEILKIQDGMWFYADPRLPAMGWRLITNDEVAAHIWLADYAAEEASFDKWDKNRLKQAVPQGSRDCAVEKATLLEYGYDELNGVDWRKGCYMGQELTARTKYRGLVKKRFLTVIADENLTEGSVLKQRESDGGKEVGVVSSVTKKVGGALIRMDRLPDSEERGYPLEQDGMPVYVRIPKWVNYKRPDDTNE